ncbi:Lrp/AsnC family transcriptional regulator [Bacillus kexueae]|uniref:Lrp/AsnC family transcriptional regulator n=1 Tax=Aeribacillus kexueae TaxID=2078952 RepID=UPI001FAFA30E|nr:Lrp/AsnC family transcriptional regulator [Bacillus kexueae]
MKLDDLDLKIIDELMKNSRLSMRELARLLNRSAPAISERIKQLESFGIIKGYTIQIDYGKVGYPVCCLFEVTIKGGQYDTFKKYVSNLPQVEFCHRIAGSACFVLKRYFHSLSDVEQFIDEVSPFATTVTHVVFSSVETKPFISL